MIYLDNAATTQMSEEVLDEMIPYLTSSYGNPGSLHRLGAEAKRAIQTARERVANFMCCDPSNIIFTSGGTEANNLVIEGTKDHLLRKGKNEIIVSSIEHESILKSVEKAKDEGIKVLYARPVNSVIKTSTVSDLVTDHTGLISIMAVNNETGYPNFVDYRRFQGCGILTHADCVQAAPYGKVDVNDFGLDFASISSHKIHGPKGIGALYCKDRNILTPMIVGGSEQEFGIRSGTENVAGIVGFGKACEIACRNNTENKNIKLYDIFMASLYNNGLKNGTDFSINSAYYGSNIMNICFYGINAETMVLLANEFGLCISAGSACRSHEDEPSYVLKEIGITDDDARCSIRISSSKNTSRHDISEAAKIFAQCVNMIKHSF